MSAVSIGERITRLAKSMREQFGSRAAEIARSQSDQADGQTREVWLSVLHRIEEMCSPTRVSEDAAYLRSTADNPPAQAMALADAAFKGGNHAVRNHWVSVAFELMSDSDITSGQTSKLTPRQHRSPWSATGSHQQRQSATKPGLLNHRCLRR